MRYTAYPWWQIVQLTASLSGALIRVESGRGSFEQLPSWKMAPACTSVARVQVLEGAVVALQLATGLRMGRSGAELADAHRGQALLEVDGLVSVAEDELHPAVAGELSWGAMLGNGGFRAPATQWLR